MAVRRQQSLKKSPTRRYKFHSTWDLPAKPTEVWQALLATPFSWHEWWPHLEKVSHVELHEDYIGTRFSCIWRAPFGYRLHADFVVDSIDYPKQLSLKATGDLVGTADWQFVAHKGGTRITIEWQVSTTKSWMNRLAPFLQTAFVYNHDQIMKNGQRGLIEYLDKTKTRSL